MDNQNLKAFITVAELGSFQKPPTALSDSIGDQQAHRPA